MLIVNSLHRWFGDTDHYNIVLYTKGIVADMRQLVMIPTIFALLTLLYHIPTIHNPINHQTTQTLVLPFCRCKYRIYEIHCIVDSYSWYIHVYVVTAFSIGRP